MTQVQIEELKEYFYQQLISWGMVNTDADGSTDFDATRENSALLLDDIFERIVISSSCQKLID